MLSTEPSWEIKWNFDHSNQTYKIGDPVTLGVTFRNKGTSQVHLQKIGVWFDWLPSGQWYWTDCNVVYQPNQWLGPVHNVHAAVPIAASIGHHDFKVGVRYRYWQNGQWFDSAPVEWGEPLGPSLNQVLVTYPPSRNFQVFISHSENDRAFAEEIAEYIRRCGQVPYLAESPSNPDLGRKLWEEKIEGALRASSAVLVLWTSNSSSSKAVQYEIDRGAKLGKRLIPAIENGASPPEPLNHLVYTRFDYSQRHDALNAIIRSLLDNESEVNKQQSGQALGLLVLLGLGLAVAGAISKE